MPSSPFVNLTLISPKWHKILKVTSRFNCSLGARLLLWKWAKYKEIFPGITLLSNICLSVSKWSTTYQEIFYNLIIILLQKINISLSTIKNLTD